jgi:hypothetical protein
MLCAAATLLPRPAQAQEAKATGIGLGVFFGFNLGPREGFEWGFEGFVTEVHEPSPLCGQLEPRSVLGATAQVGLLGVRDPRFTLAAIGGREVQRGALYYVGEVGLSYRLGSDPGPGIHFGISPGVSLLDLYGRAELLLDDYSMGGGVRLLPLFSGETYDCSKPNGGIK